MIWAILFLIAATYGAWRWYRKRRIQELLEEASFDLADYSTVARRKKERAQQALASALIHATDHDDPLDRAGWEDCADYAPSTPLPVSARLKLKYRDVNGTPTERIVQAKECDATNPQGYLIGFCEMRQGIRTFRLDRVKQAIDMETGEIIPNLLSWANAQYATSPAHAIDELLANAGDALRGLFFIGKADGRFTKKEKELFLAFCHKISGDDRITLKQIENACAYLPAPTLQAYKLICGRLAREAGNEIKAAILETAESMIATEKKVSPEEAEALSYMKKRFDTT